MSTDYKLASEDDDELSLIEESSTFSLMGMNCGEQMLFLNRASAEEIVDVAMKLLQPVLYNVPDPEKFMKDVIEVKLRGLFV